MERISYIEKDKNKIKELQKIAIEWIKYLDGMQEVSSKYDFDKIPIEYYNDQLDDIEDDNGRFDSAIQWIAWFFEIRNKEGNRWCYCCKKIEDIMVIE